MGSVAFLRTCLIFLTIPLFTAAVSCVDISLNNGKSGIEKEISSTEQIIGSVSRVIPERTDGVSNLLVRVTRSESSQNYEGTTSSNGSFSVTGNLDSEDADIEFFDSSNAETRLGSLRLIIFPGAEINIPDLTLSNGNIDIDTLGAEIIFTGQVSKNDCSDEENTGTIEVEIPSGDKAVRVSVHVEDTTRIEIRNDDEFECDAITEGDKVEVDGEMVIGGKTVKATRIDIE